MRHALFRPLASLALCILLFGCATSSKPGTSSGPITYIVTSEEELQVRDLVRTARVLSRYRDLNNLEMADIQKRLTRIFDELVTVELETLRKQEAVRATKAGRQPRPVTRADAREQLLQRLGKDLVLPVLTNENHSVVAFGRITGDGVQVTRTTFEIDQPAADLPPGSIVTTKEGSKATVITPPPLP